MYQFLQIACLYTDYYIYVLECLLFFVCNINHCNDSAPCWDLDWTIKSYLILSYVQCRQKSIALCNKPLPYLTILIVSYNLVIVL